MLETQAQIVLLVRAFEEADREGEVLSSYARATATRRALRVTGLAKWPRELADVDSSRYAETVMRRARVLFESLERKIPGLRRMIRVARLGATTGPAMIVAAFIAGLGLNTLGRDRQIHLLSPPLLGILAWNFLMYVVLLTPVLTRPARELRRVVPWLAERFLRGALWRRLHGFSVAGGGPEEWKAIAARALMRFAGSWNRHAGALLAARVRRTLHLAAAALVVGVIAGMYFRGLGLEYRVVWESTWLGPRAVQAILDAVLGPAAAVLGIDVPDVSTLRGPGRGGDARIWIHLYAMTAGLFVFLPRTVFALVECWRCRVRADLDIDLRDAYFRRAFTEWRGATRQIEIVPYSYAPKAATLAALKTLLHDYFGARADIREQAPLCYGGDDAGVRWIPRSSREPWARTVSPGVDFEDPERENCHVILFNLAQPPESEVHGRFLTDLMARLEDVRGRLLVVVDTSAYRERVKDPLRLDERCRSWERVVREAGAVAIEFDPDKPLDDQALDAVGDAIWRRPETAGAAV